MKLQLHIKTKVFILTGLMMALLVLPAGVISQPVVKIGNYAGCINKEILIPVEIRDFEDVGAITIYIGVDTDNIDYVGIENINDVFSSGDFVGGINHEGQFISFNWFSATPAYLESGIMCDIRILFKNEPVEFNFLDNCEIARSDLSVIDDVEYIDGSLVELSSLTPDPVTQTITEGSLATIELPGLSDGISCQWQENESGNWINIIDAPPYSGVQTSKLSIQSVSAEMNEGLYRCLLSNNDCSGGSVESELFVILSDVGELNGHNKIAPMHVYPNPFDEHLSCIFNINVPSAELRLIDTNGVIKNYFKLGDVIAGKVLSLQIDNTKTGIYILQLFNNGKVINEMKVLRK